MKVSKRVITAIIILVTTTSTWGEISTNLDNELITDENKSQIAGSVDTITKEEIFELKPRTTAEVLNHLPGIFIREEDGRGGRANISVRGKLNDRSRKVMVLEDGIPIGLGIYDTGEIFYLPSIGTFDEVEMLNGSRTVLYGPQSSSGVINFVTPKPSKEKQVEFIQEMGSNQFIGSAATYSNSYHELGMVLNANFRSGSGPRNPAEYQTYSGMAKLHLPLSEVSEIGLKFSYNNENSESPGFIKKSDFPSERDTVFSTNDFIFFEKYSAALTHVRHFQNTNLPIQLRTNVYGSFAKRNVWAQNIDADALAAGESYDNIFESGNTGILREVRTVGIQPQFELDNLTFGGRFHSEEEDKKTIAGTAADARSGSIRDHELTRTDAISLFGLVDLPLNEYWSMNTGARIEVISQQRKLLRKSNLHSTDAGESNFNSEILPSLGLTYQPNDHSTIFASYHLGFTPPQISERIDSNGRAQDVVAEESVNYELGFRTLSPDKATEISGTVFLSRVANDSFPETESGATLTSQQLDTKYYGVEVEGRRAFKKVMHKNWTLTPFLGLTLLESEINEAGTLEGQRLPYTPQRIVKTGLNYSNKRGLSFILEGIYSDNILAYDLSTADPEVPSSIQTIQSHHIWNFTTNLAITESSEFYFAVKNMFDENYITSINHPTAVVPGAQRQLIVGLAGRF